MTSRGSSHSLSRHRLLCDTQLDAYFTRSLNDALSNQQVEASHGTVGYVADLLTRFARSRDFYEPLESGIGLRPLALYYAEAQRGSASERMSALRRLGDVALFISGLFANSLNRKIVDVDYYIEMGGGAYASLSAASATAYVERTPCAVFRELAAKFKHFVDVLDEVGGHLAGRSDRDLLRSYEVWLRTGSPRAARRLRRQGIEPLPINHRRSH